MQETTGILMPHLTYRFLFKAGIQDEDIVNTLSRQILNVKLNYQAKTIDVAIEQPLCGGALHQFLFSWLQNRCSIQLWAIDGTSKPEYIINLIGCTCVDHRFELGYEKSEASCHHIKFEFVQLAMGSIPADSQDSVEDSHSSEPQPGLEG